jgi:hypothetical protein
MPDTLIADVLNNDAFSLVALTDSINMVPNVYGCLNQLGLFPFKGVTSPLVAVEVKNGVLNLIPSQPRGGEPNLNQGGKRALRYFNIPHFPLDDMVKAEDLERVRAFGAGDRTLALAQLLAGKQEELALKHFITLEYLRNGALKGKVLDADGGTILDLFTEFGISEKSVNFALTTEATDVAAKCREVTRHITRELKGDSLTYAHCLCGPEFYDGLVAHASVREAFLNYQASNPLRDDLSQGFKFQGIFFEEYPGAATDAAGNTRQFIPSAEARFFPMGTNQTFRTYGAPADFMEAVGTEGQPMYSKLFADEKLNRWLGVHTQSNPLPICLRPAVLVRGTKSA